jgi:hypothetical protein
MNLSEKPVSITEGAGGTFSFGTSAIYQHPLAYLVGMEGVALLRGFAGDYDREFIEARLAETRALLDSVDQFGDALMVDPIHHHRRLRRLVGGLRRAPWSRPAPTGGRATSRTGITKPVATWPQPCLAVFRSAVASSRDSATWSTRTASPSRSQPTPWPTRGSSKPGRLRPPRRLPRSRSASRHLLAPPTRRLLTTARI